MNRIKLLLLSISTGVLMWLAWTPKPLAPLLLIAFVPLLLVEDILSKKNKNAGGSVFGYSYLAFVVWNGLVTWWVGNTTEPFSGIFANTANALLMCIPFLFFYFTKKRLGAAIGYCSLVVYWLAFEYFHLQWELSWPWLTLGYGFAMYPILMQWYEYTGVLGGSLWILACNILLFRFFFADNTEEEKPSLLKRLLPPALIVLVPILWSGYIYWSYENPSRLVKRVSKQIVVVQPNIDPYGEKFDFTTLDAQLATMLKLSASKVDSFTDYLVWPETALPQGIWLNDLDSNETIKDLRAFVKKYPNLKLVTGLSAYEKYETQKTATARLISPFEKGYFDAYNSAMQIDSSPYMPIYHKSKLVPGVERMPYPGLFGFLSRYAIDMGGISGSLAMQEHRAVFFGPDSVGVAPVICYESIYGEYCTEYVRRGADFFFIITNDGWWGNTAGHKQHLQYASLLAIETRRCIARSANTGTSCFVDELGNISQATEWWQPAVIKTSLPLYSEMTFYTLHGDYLGRGAAWASLVFVIGMVVRRFKK